MSTLALEYNGKLYLSEKPTPIELLWCVAKQKDVPNGEQLASVWWCHKHYKCEYDEATMAKINQMESIAYNGLMPTASVESHAPCKK